MAPAIRLAEEDFPISRDLYRWLDRDEEWLRIANIPGLCRVLSFGDRSSGKKHFVIAISS
ncbi:hypothetical protein [Paenibacillus sp. PvP091]|uniref:hypothetical protein n=1 Tax=Paenibacillus sp. PvP091 TaxID=2806590 RepID=UPI001FD817E8|nr:MULTISPECIES: hypothetical protein [unclassified Paenibacillus]